MSEVDRQLSHAYELIEAGNYQEARDILEPLLETERDNADVWWMYSHAVEDHEKAREALENVLRIDPNYEGAEELLSETRGAPPVTVESNDDDMDDDALIDAFLDDDDFDNDLDMLDSDSNTTGGRDQETTGGRRTAILGFLLLAIIIIVVVLGFLLLNTGGDDDDEQVVAEASPEVTQPTIIDTTPIPTIGAEESVVQSSVTQEATDESENATEIIPPTDEPEDDATETTDSQAQTVDSTYAFLYEALTDLSVVDDSDELIETDLGSTLLVSICTAPGDQLRSDLRQAMNVIAEESDAFDSVDAAGVRLLDCDDDRVINAIAVSVEDARAMNTDDLVDDVYSSRWRPIG